MTYAYFDSSALVKFALRERESAALSSDAAGVSARITSVIGRIEFERAVRRARPGDAEVVIGGVLDGVSVIPLDAAIAAYAAAVRPPTMRTLDAVHLATMLAIRDDLDVAYCYDSRLAAAAAEHGIAVRAPA